jgi:pantoate--beta-alanine ligase
MPVRELTLATTRAELARARASLAGPVGLVMTMGALHEGHAELMRHARAQDLPLIVTIFVNPLQFGPQEDLSRYPRTLDHDLALCQAEGAELVFAPSVDEVYPSGEPTVRVDPGPLATVLEGAIRPGHFDGVLTVVLKVFHLVRPDVAFFGEKDYQQLTLIRGMVTDLDVPVRIVGVQTVREPDGLALSSRNRYLSAEQRELALSLSRALRTGAAAAAGGPDAVLAAARAEIPGAVELDYLALTDPALGPAPDRGPARLLIAARLGITRLLDNIAIEVAP